MENVIIGFLATACVWLCFKVFQSQAFIEHWARECDVWRKIANRRAEETEHWKNLHRALLVEQLKKQEKEK